VHGQTFIGADRIFLAASVKAGVPKSPLGLTAAMFPSAGNTTSGRIFDPYLPSNKTTMKVAIRARQFTGEIA
jgi:hypothetical protein